jgi:tetratricopeptide (TPR) repeat protein
MAILDGLPRSEAEARQALDVAAPIVQQILDAMDLSPKQREILDLVKQGHSLADIYGLTQEHRDAMFLKGCQLVQAGDIQKGRDWLTYLHMLDPLDARIVYVIAVTHQTDGNFSLAAKLYMYFIALDATNPEGYLRLGECHLSAREYDTALACFEFAKYQCGLGKGDAAAAEHAARMIAHTQDKLQARDDAGASPIDLSARLTATITFRNPRHG